MSQALQRNKRAEENYIAGQVGICVVSARCCPQGDEGHKKEQAVSRMEDQNWNQQDRQDIDQAR